MRLGVVAVAVLLCLFMATHGQRPSLGNKRRDVYIAGFFPYAKGVAESSTGRGVMPSVMLAVDHINENQTVLRNYMLHMYWNDTKVNIQQPSGGGGDSLPPRPPRNSLNVNSNSQKYFMKYLLKFYFNQYNFYYWGQVGRVVRTSSYKSVNTVKDSEIE